MAPVDNSNRSSLWNRAVGGLQMLGGGLEVAGGAGLVAVPEPTMLTKAAGAVMAVHGADTFVAGARTMWTGQVQQTATQQLATQGARTLGASEQTAERIGAGVDIAAGVGPAVGTQLMRRAAMKAAEAGAPDAVTVGYKANPGMPYGHNRVAVTSGGDTQAFHLAGPIDRPNGVNFGSTRMTAQTTQASVAVSPAQARAGAAAAQQLVDRGASTWTLLGNNCTTTARSVATAGGVGTPEWARSPSLLPFAVRNGYSVTAAGGATGSVAPAATDGGWKPR
jgi:hypothetical protein